MAGAQPQAAGDGRAQPGRTALERAALVLALLFMAALPVSIAASQILLTLAIGCWAAILYAHGERPRAPRFFKPLLAYALLTLVSVAASLDPLASLVDSKEVLLFLVVPVVYRLVRGPSAATAATVIISAGAASAVLGIVQYGIFGYDDLQQRPPGFMGHYMTYSGLLMLLVVLASARLLFDARDRAWTGLVLPALAVALVTTFTRGAWIGACAGVGLLLALKNVRLLLALPVLVLIVVAAAPAGIADRIDSIFDRRDPTSRDRVAMARAGVRIIADHPLAGVGPDMVQRVYRTTAGRTPSTRTTRTCTTCRCRSRPSGAAGAGGVAVVRRGRAARAGGAVPATRVARGGGGRPGGHGRHAHRRPVRVQLRRLGVPDAAAGAADAPRGRARRGPVQP